MSYKIEIGTQKILRDGFKKVSRARRPVGLEGGARGPTAPSWALHARLRPANVAVQRYQSWRDPARLSTAFMRLTN